MKKLIIADVRSTSVDGKVVGHYFAVADNYCEMFGNNCEVQVAGGPIYQNRYSNWLHLNFDTDEKEATPIRKKKVLSNVRQLFQKSAGYTVVLQCNAVATAYLGIALYKRKNSKLFMIQYNTLGLDSKLKRFLYRLAKNKIDGVICPQDNIGSAYERPYCVVPDYIYTGNKVEPGLQYDEKTYDFSMIGIIERDKGIIEAAKKLKNTKYKVLIAGFPQNKEIEGEIRSVCEGCSNITLKLEYLSEEEYRAGIRMSKYCILNYSGAYSEHSSGVVFDILFNGVPVVGRNCKSLSFIYGYKVGHIYDDILQWSPGELMDVEIYRDYLQNIEKYYKKHTEYRNKLAEFIGTKD